MIPVKSPRIVPPKAIRTVNLLFLDRKGVAVLYQGIANTHRISIINIDTQNEGGAIRIEKIGKNNVLIFVEFHDGGGGPFLMDTETSLCLTNTDEETIINVSLQSIEHHYIQHPLNN